MWKKIEKEFRLLNKIEGSTNAGLLDEQLTQELIILSRMKMTEQAMNI